MSNSMPKKSALAVALLSCGLAFTATAQTSGTTSGGTTTTRTPAAPSATDTTRPSATTGSGSTAAGTTSGATDTSSGNAMSRSSTGSSNSAALDSKDRKFIEKAAQGGMAEIELGKLAQQKAASDQVKQFASRIVDDHSKANEQLKQIASSKGVAIPSDLDRSTRREIEKLQKLSGAKFDREYMELMVSDHKKDVKEFQAEAKSAKDSDIKNFASSTLPTLEQHLDLAKSTQAVVKSGPDRSASAINRTNTRGVEKPGG
jgi:putative membrane protein